ncbi:uncharacterized protein LOC109863799 isoform X2 [Pseudomyrmex gracilis]|uniref:uncharacterized protein LOC109863799 isoform X2 n=1 Tax=Pseudomyrmex gracilis TaxID=219809 RepID=UPI000995A7E0|nr:uncharacterized protein LOC109863799 isoform X2 [Pseudomyrmex gracilis]
MLLQNLQVGRHILNNVAKNLSPFGRRFSKEVPENDKFVRQSEVKIRNITPEGHKKNREQCPRLLSFRQLCKKLFFLSEKQSNPSFKCETTTASDDYLNARRSVELRIENIIQLVESESQSIAKDVKTRLENSEIARAAQLRELYKQTSEKLDEVVKLDVSYGFWMRKETLLLNDEIGRSFDALERAIAPNVKRITFMLRTLKNNVLARARQTEETVATCRRHKVPSELTDCVRKQLSEATKTIDRTNEETRINLERIGKYRDAFTKAHETTMQETLELNRKKVAELLKYMEKCIVWLKKSSED